MSRLDSTLERRSVATDWDVYHACATPTRDVLGSVRAPIVSDDHLSGDPQARDRRVRFADARLECLGLVETGKHDAELHRARDGDGGVFGQRGR